MVLVNGCHLIFYLSFLSWINDCHARNKPHRPRIYPQDTQIDWLQDNIQLICRHTSPNITWSFPNIKDIELYNVEVVTGTYDFTEYKYVSVLKVTNLNYFHSGYYYCSDSANGLGSQIYVHVQGPRDFDDGESDRTLSAYLYQRFIIPCLATHTLATFSLLKFVPGKDPVEVSHSTSSEGPIRYVPRVGFVFLNALPQQEGRYACSRNSAFFSFSLKSIQLNIAPRTYITGPPDSTALIGGDLELTCEVFLDHNATLTLRWALPELTLKRKSRISQVRTNNQRNDGLYSYKSVLSVKDVSKDDQGVYYCISQMNGMTNKLTSLYIHVIGDTSVSLKPPRRSRREVLSLTDVQPRLDVTVDTSDPSTEVAWLRNEEIILSSRSVRVCMEENMEGILRRSWLQFDNLTWKDAGYYGLLGRTWNVIQTTSLVVYGVRIERTQNYHSLRSRGGKGFFQCFGLVNNGSTSAVGTFQWSFRRCSKRGTCEQASRTVADFESCGARLVGCSNAYLQLQHSGILYCTAVYVPTSGKMNYATDSTEIVVVRGQEPLFVERNGKRNVVVGEVINMSCSASSYMFSNESIAWIHNGQLVTLDGSREMVMRPWRTQWSYDLELIITDAREDDSGSYQCVAKEYESDVPTMSSEVEVQVKESSSPRIVSTQLNGGVTQVEPGSVLELDCQAEGWLEPDISWFRVTSGEVMEEENLNVTGGILRIFPVARTDVGKYTCRATNQAGQTEAFVDIILEGSETPTIDLAIPLGAVAAIAFTLAVFGILLGRYIHIQRKRLRELAYDLELVHGSENMIDPGLPVNDQPENLFYDPKWEFNRERVKLGKKLGSGAFGVVYEAEAVGIDGSDGPVKVAAKTVKPPASVQELKSLIDEMKMMAHVGKHLNVVSLLGACTRNLRSGTLLVLVEYCKYGNILQVLRRRREDYVDELDPITGMIDRRGDVHLDLEGRTTTTHLVSWSLQVARGMGHLGSKMVVHRDLAARNVLLCSNNVVKICDFGLAREEYYYKKKKKGEGGGLLPVKWMAIESIRDRTFSTMSDVWSYGVLLWEIFSLGEDPYPGIYIRDVYRMLLGGYRMSKPRFQPFFIYALMSQCWHVNPEKRPTFSHLEREINSLLKDRVKRFYLEPSSAACDDTEKRYVDMMQVQGAQYIPPTDAAQPEGYANVPSVPPDGYFLMSSAGGTDTTNMEEMEMNEMGSQMRLNPSK